MGCLKAIAVRVASMIIFGVLVILAVLYHREILDYLDAWRGRSHTFVAPAAHGPSSVSSSSLADLARAGGPAYVDLGAADLASLVAASVTGNGVFDSVQVALLEGEVRVRGSLDLRQVPRSVLGPFASAIGDREPVTIGGPLSVDSVGHLIMAVTYLTVKDFPFPRGTIPRILQELHIPGVSGSRVPIPLAVRLGDVRVSPDHVRFYRASPR